MPATVPKRSSSGASLPPHKKLKTVRPPSQAKRLEATYREVGAVAKSSSEAFISEMQKYREGTEASTQIYIQQQAKLLHIMESVADSMKEADNNRKKQHEEQMALEQRKIELGQQILDKIKKTECRK